MKCATMRIKLVLVCCPVRTLWRSDRGKLLSMRVALRRRERLPPIDVVKISGGYFLLHDGYHRFNAHYQEDRRTILANVIGEA